MHHTERELPFICLFAIGICCVLSPSSFLLLFCIEFPLCCRCLIYYEIRTWLLVFQMLLAQAIISNSSPKKERRMERTPAGQLLIDTHKQAKEMPCNPLHWASLRTYTPFAISALNLIYIHFIIFAFSATPTQPRPALPYPVLPCPTLPASLRTDLWQSPLVVFSVTVVPCGANEFKCVRN